MYIRNKTENLSKYPLSNLKEFYGICKSSKEEIDLSIGQVSESLPEEFKSTFNKRFDNMNKYPNLKGSDDVLNDIEFWMKKV
ncbi:hypothetical protein ABN702_12755 [Bacillus haimaensis]|uniref:hypothetical protein n=1 Tax=Bacillus haimaensis TaxID=3160967 RepID=UPI003AA8254A